MAVKLEPDFGVLGNLELTEKISQKVGLCIEACGRQTSSHAMDQDVSFLLMTTLWSKIKIFSSVSEVGPPVHPTTQRDEFCRLLLNALMRIKKTVDFSEQPHHDSCITHAEQKSLSVVFSVLVFALSFLASQCSASDLPTARSWISGAFTISMWTMLRCNGWSVWIPEIHRPHHGSKTLDTLDLFASLTLCTSGLLVKAVHLLCCLIALVPAHKLPLEVIGTADIRGYMNEITQSIPSPRVMKGINMMAHLFPMLFTPNYCLQLSYCLDRLIQNVAVNFVPGKCLKEVCFLASLILDTYSCILTQHHGDNVFLLFMEAGLKLECLFRKFRQVNETFTLIPTLILLVNQSPAKSMFLFLRSRPNHPDLQALMQLLCNECRHIMTTTVLAIMPTQPIAPRCGLALVMDTCDLELHIIEHGTTTAKFGLHRVVVAQKSKFFQHGLLSPFAKQKSVDGRVVMSVVDQPAWCVLFVLKHMYSGMQLKINHDPAFVTTPLSEDFDHEGMKLFALERSAHVFRVSVHDAITCFMVADYFGVEGLCRAIESELCHSDLTIDTVEAITMMAMNFMNVHEIGFRFAPMLLWRCHQFALSHPMEMVGTQAFFSALLSLEHGAQSRATHAHALCISRTDNCFDLNMFGVVIDHDFLFDLSLKMGVECCEGLKHVKTTTSVTHV